MPVVSPTDPIFFVSSIPLAAALYGRPERDRPRWLFDIVVLDLILIALFGAFIYTYFVVTIAVTGGSTDVYDDELPAVAERQEPAAGAVGDVGVAHGAIDAWRRCSASMPPGSPRSSPAA